MVEKPFVIDNKTLMKLDNMNIVMVENYLFSKLTQMIKKYLNENNYKKIRIGHNEILVTGANHDFDDSNTNSKFIDTLKGLDRKHIIDDVIEHFLESHTINSVSNYDFSGKSINVLGNDDV